MPRIAPWFLVPVVAASTGCGSPEPAIPSATTTTTRTASFPVTISRLGGVAGFRQSITVQADGEVLATTNQGRVTCTLDEASLAALAEGAAFIRDTDTPSADATPPADAMKVLIGAGTGVVSVDDPRAAEVAPVVAQLLEDVTGPKAQRKICE